MAKPTVRRVYDEPAPGDGTRILVDRLWPRGVAKADVELDDWLKDVAPSKELRAGSATIRTGSPSSAAATGTS